MKVHYINILLFALPLNILIYNQRNHKSTTHHTLKIPITRLLCECELYAPTNYDSDPEMKRVMQQFVDRTTQRFHEYDNRMKDKRQKCKDKCDKEIQKIILKDKLEKELMDKFATLQTDIQNDAIPTCVCEKSLADKVEKVCFRCGGLLGGGIAPGWGLVSGLGYVGWTNYVTQTALQKGIEAVISYLEQIPGIKGLPGFNLANIVNPNNYSSGGLLTTAIDAAARPICSVNHSKTPAFCSYATQNGGSIIAKVSVDAENAANAGIDAASAEAANLAPKTLTLTNTIIVSFVAIVVIVLVMLIIYFILHYRRKKKMKKKLQYIKLLKE
ncbi:rifin [Plasmodium falciparum NF54]|uniref:Rifin n=2 Tax=Plasmodium falciparum TaxID=5833 RepID=O96295_PLAF7|nr:rifin [Plasmodium falciparum 3D7]KAF4331287.1 rifin [Plasmodium falciparum NF54]PKC46263.1 rifin [Plasmodium falciparum NF54]CZT98246.1 rifin [Plasmodium falciparum 3D7]|eukprot:XP_001349736.1 rifin [Plasmodium falciparum 3D7]